MGKLDVEIMNGSTGMLAYYTMLDFFSFKDHKFKHTIPYGVCRTSIIVLVLFLSDWTFQRAGPDGISLSLS